MLPSRARRVVDEREWTKVNESYLFDIFEFIQNANMRSGRTVLDMSFAEFCRLAYAHSTIYPKESRWMQ